MPGRWGGVGRLVVVLRTERLLLRELAERDWPAFHAIESDPEVTRYQSFTPRTPESSRAYIKRAREEARVEPRLIYDLGVVLKAQDRLIGRCGLGVNRPELPVAALWYTLDPTFWKQGYATEAARAMVDFGFRRLGLHRIWADCDAANRGSVRVLEKIGMRREAHLRENAWNDGGWTDTLIYAILNREWP